MNFKSVCARVLIRLLLFFACLLNIVTFSCGFLHAASSSFQQIKPNQLNIVDFAPVQAKRLRFIIYSSLNGAPAVDELSIYGSDKPDSPNLARTDVKNVAASSCISGYAIHRTGNINDGVSGNDSSWVAAEIPTRESPQWVSVEWNSPVTIARVVFSRDLLSRYSDRIPLEFAIQVSDNENNWRNVAVIHGTTEDVSCGELSEYGASWFRNVPTGRTWNWNPLEGENVGGCLSEYDRQLQTAFLAEENAILKTAGFADCEPWLIQRHYPEYVEPEHKPDAIVPLPCVSSLKTDGDSKFFSSGSVYAFAPGSFASGPVIEQTAEAIAVGSELILRITGNRFLSENVALVSTEKVPCRGLLVYRDGKIFWRQLDSLDGRETGSMLELSGSFDSEKGTFDAVIPLELLPEWKERGIYVSLGIGALHVLPGGRPVHFRPADFSASFSRSQKGESRFLLTLHSYCNRPITLSNASGETLLGPFETKVLTFSGKYGQAGSETVWMVQDEESGKGYCIPIFRYDPCFRPLCQLKDAFERADGVASDRFDERDYEKRFSIPGSVNPRYVDVNSYRRENDLDEYEALNHFFADLDVLTEDEGSVKHEAKKAWNAWREHLQETNSDRILFSIIEERTLFWNIRRLKRRLFLSNPELSATKRILANKRNPFWPSHNYSDLFDSTWNPGGSVVLIDIPEKDGRLAPELATTKNIVDAGSGVIRNPSASFDARRIYYARRENPDDYFKIYEFDLESGQERLISPPGPFHDFWPIELPDGGLAFISTRCKKKFICWRPQAFVLYRMNKDGTNVAPLSHANLSEFAPSVTDNGTIIWTRSEYVDKGADYGHTLWTIRPDGFSPELVFGNTINLPQGYANGRPVPDSEEISCVLISHFGDLNGPVALIDISRGPHDPAAIRSITPEVPWPGFWARTETFREPVPVSRDVFLVAHAALERFGLYLIDRYGNRELLTIDNSIDTICPQPFYERDVPPVVENSLDASLAQEGLGRFSVANVYRGLEGYVKQGEAKYLRVCQEIPSHLKQLDDGSFQSDHEPFMEYYASPVDVLSGSCGWPSYVAKGVLGTVEIEEDGSVDFLAPANKVLFFELLDEDFNEIQRMRSVVQLQPGERRSCIGCHENRLSVPSGGLSLASTREPQTISAPPWGEGAFWYERMVQPALDKQCVRCHNRERSESNPKLLDLSGTRDQNKIPASYRSLIQSGSVNYFDYTWGAGKTTKAQPYTFGVSQSSIWKTLSDDNHRDVVLSSEDSQAIKCWIDLNVPLWGDYQMRRERK